MVTMEASSTTISWATAMTIRATQRLGSGSGLTGSSLKGPGGWGDESSSVTVAMGGLLGVGGVGWRTTDEVSGGELRMKQWEDDVVHHVDAELLIDRQALDDQP